MPPWITRSPRYLGRVMTRWGEAAPAKNASLYFAHRLLSTPKPPQSSLHGLTGQPKTMLATCREAALDHPVKPGDDALVGWGDLQIVTVMAKIHKHNPFC